MKKILAIKREAISRAEDLGHRMSRGWFVVDRDRDNEERIASNCARCLAGVEITDHTVHPRGRPTPMEPGAYGRAVEEPCKPLARRKTNADPA